MAILNDFDVGTIVKIKESGRYENYIIIHKGLPSSKYDSSCDGVWLWREDCYIHANSATDWERYSGDTYYQFESTSVYSILNGIFADRYDSVIRSSIKSVKLPDLTNPVKVFILAADEVGYSNRDLNDEGSISSEGYWFYEKCAELDYFYSGTTVGAYEKRYFRGQMNGGYGQFLRTLMNRTTGRDNTVIYNIAIMGISHRDLDMNSLPNLIPSPNSSAYIRPAIVLPKNMRVDSNRNVVGNTPPTNPSSITVSPPNNITPSDSIAISWTQGSDPDGDSITYNVLADYTKLNGSIETLSIYTGSGRSCSDVIPRDTYKSVKYKVRCYDSHGTYSSGYTYSTQITIINNRPPTNPGSVSVNMSQNFREYIR